MTDEKKALVSSLLRALVLAAAAVILCWPLTVWTGVAAAAAGALAGAVIADRLNARPELRTLRLASVLALAALALLAGVWAARLLVSSALVAGLLGPVVTLAVSEALLWLALVLPSVFALRYTAGRRPLLVVLEVLAVGLALAASFAAHRGGMVHRPLEIGDWAWSRGIDPVLVFLALGGLAALLLAALLLSEERKRRVPLHLSALFAVALALFFLIRVNGLPKPQAAGELGLTGEPESAAEDSEGAQGGASGGRGNQLGDLEFKDEYASSGEQAPVAVVVLHDDYSPPSGVFYFRQSVFSQWNGRRLVQATRGDVDRDLIPRFPTRALEVAAKPPARRRMPLETSIGLLIDHVRPFALDSPALIRPVRNPNPLHFQRTFQVLSQVPTMPYRDMIGARAGDPDWSGEQWRHYTEAPRDPRYDALAARLLDRLLPEYRDDPLAQALAIKAYLDENGIYSRRSTHAGASDPAASFLFGDLTGYCVHFAHAATYLFRHLDIPARVAAGYAVEETSRGSGSSIMIRGGNAHAWPEIYLDGVGWVVVDLAPETVLDEPTQSPDQALQRMLGEMLRQELGEETGLDDELREALTLAQVLRFLGAVVLALLAVAYAGKLYRALAPRLVRSRELYRVAYRAALDRLAEVGWRRRYGESRERFAARTAELAPSFAALSERHLRAALGARRDADAALLRRLGGEVRGDLRRRVPGWRRALGALDPISWLWVR